MTPTLNARREMFCREYVVDFDGKAAAMRSGFAAKNAAAQASRLLKFPAVQERIRSLMAERAKRVEINADQVLRELARIGFSDIRALFKDDGAMKDPKDWPKSLARAIASIEVDEILVEGRLVGYTKKVKFWPKVQALELIGRHISLFPNKHVLEAGKSLEALVAESRKKDEGEKA